MKKILIVLLATASLAALADDSYLYWMVGDTGTYDYSAVQVKQVNTSDGSLIGYLNLYAPDGETPMASPISRTDVETVANNNRGFYAQLASNSAYSSFIIELVNSTGGFVAQSDELSYSDALASYIVNSGSMTIPTTQVWNASGYAVPEPNSALLLMIGCAALGLRRRKAHLV